MIRPELLAILCCPETHQPLRLADAAEVQKINAAIAAGTIKTKSGQPITGPLDGALIREDNKVVYIIRQKIPVLLIDEALPLPGLIS